MFIKLTSATTGEAAYYKADAIVGVMPAEPQHIQMMPKAVTLIQTDGMVYAVQENTDTVLDLVKANVTTEGRR